MQCRYQKLVASFNSLLLMKIFGLERKTGFAIDFHQLNSPLVSTGADVRAKGSIQAVSDEQGMLLQSVPVWGAGGTSGWLHSVTALHVLVFSPGEVFTGRCVSGLFANLPDPVQHSAQS